MRKQESQRSILHKLYSALFGYKPENTHKQTSKRTALLQRPQTNDHDEWYLYWQALDQPWRTEPEIDTESQNYLAEQRSITPDIEQGIYPFKDVKLSRADVEWLLATHENGRGPVDWSDTSQRTRKGLDLRGANLAGVDLNGLPLAAMYGGLTGSERIATATRLHNMAAVHMEGSDLYEAHLEGARLSTAHLEKANLYAAHLEGARLYAAHLEGANLRFAFLDSTTNLDSISLGNEKYGFATLVDVRWSDVNLAMVNWAKIQMLGDEQNARQIKISDGKKKDRKERLRDFRRAVRGNRQLAVVLQSQGLNEVAARFAYRAQVLQRSVFWFRMLQPRLNLGQRGLTFGAWFFSWFLFLLAGYGYRPLRSFLAYILVISGFATIYYLLGPHLAWNEAIVISMTAFHGRGFSQTNSSQATPKRLWLPLKPLWDY